MRLAKNCPDVVLTSYGVVRRETATLKAMPRQVLVVDEAQNLKNPAAAQTKAIKAIPARCFVAMSGTPVENRLSEYWVTTWATSPVSSRNTPRLSRLTVTSK
jgi:SNF2 family DNA or RNA helicase